MDDTQVTPTPPQPQMQPQPQPPQTPITPTPTPEPSKAGREGFGSIFSTLTLFICAPLIALALTMFVFQSYEVDGPSMQTTLQNHDRLIVLKLPRTWARVTGHPYQPARTDIVIFNHSDSIDLGAASSRQLIKRVIALPGERVVVKDGVLTVYNKEHPDGFQPDKTYPYGKVIGYTSGDVDLVVPPNNVFVCGDNRPNSLDSRYFGPVPMADLVGKLGLRVYPLSHAQAF